MKARAALVSRAVILAALGALAACGDRKGADPGSAPTAVAQPAPPTPAAPLPAGPLALDGAWRITAAKNMTGQPYGGSVAMRRAGATWDMSWTLKDGSTQKGVGLDLGNGTLAAGWGGSGAFGVVVYDIAGGTLTGTWAQNGVAGQGTEVLSGPTPLGGTYTITSAKNASGAAYQGTVVIRQTGPLYDLTWSTGGQVQRGVGQIVGNKLIAGWGIGVGAGFVHYRLTSPNRLEGVWAPVGASSTATEVLER
jgi:hypothetical protein